MAREQNPKGLTKPCILLIVIAGMERFAFKGVASNLVTYLTDIIHLSNSTAAKTVNSWCGFTSIMPLLLAPIAESLWDHYSTILVSSFFYILGLAALTSSTFEWAWPVSKSISTSFMFWSLCLISLGQGGYNPSLQAFGADQLGDEDDLPSNQTDLKKSSKRTLFFTWWYFGVCSGSLLGISLMSYIQDTLGWSLGFAVPTLIMIASILLFSSGTRCYAFNFPDDQRADDHTPFKDMADGLKAVISRVFYCGVGESNHKGNAPELELQDNKLSSQKLVGSKEVDAKPNKNISLYDKVKVSIRLLPIWTMLLLFAVIFQQPSTFFTKQGMTMKRNIGTKFKIPPATLQGVITVSIMLLMPLYDKVLVPCTQVITRNKTGITVLQRMGAGMVLSIIAMVIAALVEEKRLKTPSLNIFWLLPQYILLGVSDIFTVVGMQEFFYGEVPVKMRTTGIALYTSVFGVGSFLSAIMISLVEVFTTKGGQQSWFSDDMSKARLDKYYWLLAALSSFSLLVYIVLCRFHKSRSDLGDENDV